MRAAAMAFVVMAGLWPPAAQHLAQLCRQQATRHTGAVSLARSAVLAGCEGTCLAPMYVYVSTTAAPPFQGLAHALAAPLRGLIPWLVSVAAGPTAVAPGGAQQCCAARHLHFAEAHAL